MSFSRSLKSIAISCASSLACSVLFHYDGAGEEEKDSESTKRSSSRSPELSSSVANFETSSLSKDTFFPSAFMSSIIHQKGIEIGMENLTPRYLLLCPQLHQTLLSQPIANSTRN